MIGGGNFGGVTVRVSPDHAVPHQKLSENLVLDAEFRDSFNKWLADWFGVEYKNMLDDGQVIGGGGGVVICNPRTYEIIKRNLEHYHGN